MTNLPASPFLQRTPQGPSQATQASQDSGDQLEQHLSQRQQTQEQHAQLAADGSAPHAAVSAPVELAGHSWLPNARVLWGQASLPGTRYGSLNQDHVLTIELHDAKHLRRTRWPQCHATCVLDGHGMLGEAAAREAGAAIMHSIKHSELRHRRLEDLGEEQVAALVGAAFQEGHTSALAVYDEAPPTYIYPQGSSYEQRYTLHTDPATGDKVYASPYIGGRLLEFGTTATLALVQGTALAVASVGDSLAVLGREEGDEYVAELVSVRHSGWDAGERSRVEGQYGDSVSISPEDGYLVVQEGRLRGFQLAMTRALGHRLLPLYGVIATPSVTLYQLRAQHVCLIVATDGVWEVLSPEAAVKLVCDALAEGRSAEGAAHELCAEAVRLASGGPVRAPGQADNTTAAVFVFAEL